MTAHIYLKRKDKKKGKETHSSRFPQTVSLLRSSFNLEAARPPDSLKADASPEAERNGLWRVRYTLASPNCRSDTELLVEIASILLEVRLDKEPPTFLTLHTKTLTWLKRWGGSQGRRALGSAGRYETMVGSHRSPPALWCNRPGYPLWATVLYFMK